MLLGGHARGGRRRDRGQGRPGGRPVLLRFTDPSPLTDAMARERALDLAQARGTLQEAFAQRLLANPGAVRARVCRTLEQCAEAFLETARSGVTAQLATDVRLKHDLLKRGASRRLSRPSPVPSPPQVSRHLTALRRASLLTARRQGRYVRYAAGLPDPSALGTDLPTAALR
ncbi:DUF5937 family protein [Streptomyces anandii]|uniref:DUF5937 family protein n=1 Tax=Streptomyces anandii TaxID=285454 RepID=UPI0036865869